MMEQRNKNIVAKVVALVLATVLWLYVMNEQNPPIETTFNAPLEIRNVAQSTIIMDAPETVRVKLRGPRSLVAGVMPKDIKPFIDVKGLAEGRHSLKVNVLLPASLELVEITPDKTSVKIDAAMQRKLAVSVRMTGIAGTGIVVGKTAANPGQVTVQGPKSIIDAIDKVVASVDLTGKTKDISEDVPVIIYGRDGREIEGLLVSPPKVTVTAALSQIPDKKTVDVKTVVYGDLPTGITLHRISGTPDKVELQGDPFVLEKIEFIYTEPINISGIDKTVTKNVKLQLKEGVTAIPDTISVQLEVGAPRR